VSSHSPESKRRRELHGRRVIGIDLDGTQQVSDGLADAFSRELAEVKRSQQILVVGFAIDFGSIGCLGHRLRFQLQLNLLGNCQCHFGLYYQDVAQIPVVRLRPKMALVLCTDELGGDPHPLGTGADGTFQDPIDAQFTGNPLHSLAGPLVSHRGGSRDHTQAFGL
jgi:hypothetical protein